MYVLTLTSHRMSCKTRVKCDKRWKSQLANKKQIPISGFVCHTDEMGTISLTKANYYSEGEKLLCKDTCQKHTRLSYLSNITLYKIKIGFISRWVAKVINFRSSSIITITAEKMSRKWKKVTIKGRICFLWGVNNRFSLLKLWRSWAKLQGLLRSFN